MESIEQTFTSGDLSGAHRQAIEALGAVGTGDPLHSRVMVELGKIDLAQGRSEEALRVLGVPLADNAPEEILVRRHLVLALALARVGQVDRAERELAEAKTSPQAGPGGSLEGEWASTCGGLDLDKGRLTDAQRMFRKALVIAQAQHDRFLEAGMLLNLGVVALQDEHYEEALGQFSRAKEVAASIHAELLLEKITGSIGFALYGLGDFLGSQQSFQNAQRLAEAVGSPIDRVRWLNNEGLSDFRLGNVASARSAYERSLREAEAIGMQEGVADAHAALGVLLLDQDNGSAAFHIAEAARVSGLRRNLPDELHAQLLEAMLQARTGEARRAARSLAALDQNKELIPSLHWQAEQELARVNLRLGDYRTAERWFRIAIGTFHRQRLSLEDVESTLPFFENGTDLYSDYVRFLVSRGRTDDALTVVDQSRAEALAGKSAEHTGERGPGAEGRQQLAARLNGTILVYYVLPRESYLWVTTAKRSVFCRVAGGTEIAPLIEAHRHAILGAKNLLSAESDPAGRQLFERLVAPANGLLPHGGRVFLVRDGPLSELNFETLINPEGRPHFWIEDAVITNAPALRLLPSSRKPVLSAQQPRRMLLLGDPRYGAGDYVALPKAAEEVRDVMGHFAPESRTVLTGEQATPAAYRAQQLDRFSYIHFVAHSTANASKPLDSSVVLSRGDDGGDKLYARDIMAGRLQAELVTISGCNSSGSRVYAGEGPVGLAWAFERAGARNVIGSLWEVDDASTPALMDRMYARLLDGAAPDVALRDAKLFLLHSPGVFQKALYWAPFQLYSSS